MTAVSSMSMPATRLEHDLPGRVGRRVEVDDDTLGLVASEDLNPQKARVLLRLALFKPRSLANIQRLFVGY